MLGHTLVGIFDLDTVITCSSLCTRALAGLKCQDVSNMRRPLVVIGECLN